MAFIVKSMCVNKNCRKNRTEGYLLNSLDLNGCPLNAKINIVGKAYAKKW